MRVTEGMLRVTRQPSQGPAGLTHLRSHRRAPTLRRGTAVRPHDRLRLVSSTALRISRVTTSGCDTMDACEAVTSSIRAFPRSAMNRCPAGGMARSSVPSRFATFLDPAVQRAAGGSGC